MNSQIGHSAYPILNERHQSTPAVPFLRGEVFITKTRDLLLAVQTIQREAVLLGDFFTQGLMLWRPDDVHFAHIDTIMP